MDQLPKDDILGRANVLKTKLEDADAKRQELQRLDDEKREANQRQSDERTSQFIELMEEHDIHPVSLFTQDPYTATTLKTYIGEGWIVREVEMGEDSWHKPRVVMPGLILLKDGDTYWWDRADDVSVFAKGKCFAPFAGDAGLNILGMAAIKHKLV